MPKRFLCLLCLILLAACAKRGSISGGLKDTIPPVLIQSIPKNYSTGVNTREIRLVFDEYIKLKNVNKQLTVSPPMDKQVEISPLTASKTIRIRINDTLKPDTTYSLNFGQSIEDNNESNPYPQFKYVFSTGSYIDSLKLQGTVKDSYAKAPEPNVSVMLYELNDTYNDSAIYKRSPRYLATTVDSGRTYSLENLKAGKYRLMAVTDLNSNNRFDPKTEKIGFRAEPITIPNDTLYQLELFKEEMPFKPNKPSQAAGGRLILGYQGRIKNAEVEVFQGSQKIESQISAIQNKDSVNIWYKGVKEDSLRILIRRNAFNEQFTIKVRDQKKDSLSFTSKHASVLPLSNNFTLLSGTPISNVDASKIILTAKDSARVSFTTNYDSLKQELQFEFTKEPAMKYTMTLIPGAFRDFHDRTNDSLVFKFSTKNPSDYGNLRVPLLNVRRFPVIVELADAKGEAVASAYSEGENFVEFLLINPSLYTMRLIYDDNSNRVWDTGNFLEKRQSEEVIYFPKEIDVRSNWDVEQPFSLP